MGDGYAYDHALDERVRLAGLETALDPGTREHLRKPTLQSGATGAASCGARSTQ
jgi:hypothetical protein